MTDVYKQLAGKLDELPSGYPATESGVELKFLRKIFSPEEAEMALKMRLMPETVEAIAERLGKPVAEMQRILADMVEKGQIGPVKMFGQQMYMLFPFIVGIYDFQLKQIDEEMAHLFEEYFPVLAQTIGGFEPAMARVVPVSTEIKQDLHVHRYEDIRRMILEARSLQLAECICRKEGALLGHGCGHTLETCIGISNEEHAFDKFPRGRIISKEEALNVITDAEEEGLIHCSYNVEKRQFFLCNCCPCCCLFLRGAKEFKAPHILVRSHFVAAIEQESCTACGVCANERCPMDAIVEHNGNYRVLAERCIGCGVCTRKCPAESIKLVRKPESEHDGPPADLMEWNFKRAASRGVEMKLE